VIAEELGRDAAADSERCESTLPSRPEEILCEKRQAQAGVHEIAGRHIEGGQVRDAGFERRTQLGWRGRLEHLDRTALSIDGQNTPACTQEFACVPACAAAKVHCKARA
jgi:hypothetical protein